jgi:hypothetical protein
MKMIKITEARVTLLALVEDPAPERPTMIDRRGVALAMLGPIDEAGKLGQQKARGFADLLLSFPGGAEFERNASPPCDVDV